MITPHATVWPTVTAAHLAVAIQQAASMDMKDMEVVYDRIYVAQPNLLASVLALRSFGVPMATIDVLVNLLIVIHLSIEASRQVLAVVSEADLDREFPRFTASVQFTSGLPEKSVGQSIAQTTAYQREQFLLAYVVETLQRAGLSSVHDEKSKLSVLVAINLVNCISTARRIRP